MNNSLSSSLEDYLEAIYKIIDAKQAVRVKDLAKDLNVKSSSVTGALKILADKGLINYAPYDVITLTDKGKEIAKSTFRKHSILEKFLKEILFVEETTAKETACLIEHNVNCHTINTLQKLIDFMYNNTKCFDDYKKSLK